MYSDGKNSSWSRFKITLYVVEALAALLLLFVYHSPFGHSSSYPDVPVETGTLLFVEDVDGVGGTSAGDFGDLVALNPRTGERHRLTHDDHYDTHPSWGPDGRYVLFESKRRQNPMGDMGAPSHIYRLEVSSGTITRWRPGLAERFEAVSEASGKPAVSPSGQKVAFVTYPDGKPSSGWIVIYDRERDRLSVVADSLPYIHRITWPEDESYLAFSAVPYGEPIQHFTVYVADLRTGEMALTIQDSTHYFRLGDVLNGRVLYYRAGAGDDSVWQTTYPDRQDPKRVDAYGPSTEKFRAPVYAGQDSIYVLASNSTSKDGEGRLHVCVQSLWEEERHCLTDEPNYRVGLRILR